MITGLIEPTFGSAQAFDIDIFEEMDELRKYLGVCP
jgi:ABC-type multidrug transport system ATPase subunit